MTNETRVSTEPVNPSRWNHTTTAVAVLAAALAGGDIYLVNRANTLQGDMEGMRAAMKTEISNMQQIEQSTATQHARLIEALDNKIAETGSLSSKAVSRAMAQANLSAKKVSTDLNKRIEEQQQAALEQHKAVTAQLGELKDDTTTKVTGIATDVSGVKTEVAQTKSDLQKTITDLHSVRGDMGVQSGLIATNAKELDALKQLGEREYVEFELSKTKTPQRIGGVAVQLKKFDAKRNRYTIELIANDKRVEKKDRTINEPVQFYMASARVPYEIVVNEVRNDKIVGYLAEPKVRNIR